MSEIIYSKGSYIYDKPDTDLILYADIIRPGKEIIIKCKNIIIKPGTVLSARTVEIHCKEATFNGTVYYHALVLNFDKIHKMCKFIGT